MGRKLGAVVVGLAVVGVVVMALQWAGSMLYPLPEGLDPMAPEDREAFKDFLAGMPPTSWALAFGSELLGAFLGAWAAGRIAGSRGAWFAAGIVAAALVGSVMNWTAFPHPAWFMVGQAAGYPLVLVAVMRLLGRERAGSRTTARV